MAEIRLENLSRSFGSVTVLSDIDLSIREGEFFTFVGPSGCGKSTVLNLIAGLDAPSCGRILFDGRDVVSLSPRERDVAMVFQSYALYPHMTVFENLAFPLRMAKESGGVIDERVRDVAALLGIGDLLFRRPRALSGGQRQRVALGRALIRKPAVFLMDEPLSNLDARLRVDMRTELKRLHQELGITTIYVTHDQAEAMSLSGRIAVLEKGGLRQVGAPREVYERPSDTFVAGFIGSPAMNFIEASVRDHEAGEIEMNGMVFRAPVPVPVSQEQVIAGIRPEAIIVSATAGRAIIEARVVTIEPVGPVTWVEVQWGAVSIRGAAKPSDEFTPGGKAYVGLPSIGISLFDKLSGKRL